MKEFLINENDANQRVDKFIQKTLKKLPKSLLYKSIRNKKIKVNRKRCEISQRLQVGDTIQCFLSEDFFETDEQVYDFLKVSAQIDILYEDDDILVVNKPSGLLAHRNVQGVQDTLSDRILHYLYDKGSYDPAKEQSFTPALCHRIDRNTQGILIAAKNAAALRGINEHIRNHEVNKKYMCIVQGVFKKQSGDIVLYHRKAANNKAEVRAYPSQGYKKMESIYRVVQQGKQHALVEVELVSGRSHQIRVMMAYLHHPLLGDVKYGATHNGQHTYQELCAYHVEFHFPIHTALSSLDGLVFELEHVEVVEHFYKQYYQN